MHVLVNTVDRLTSFTRHGSRLAAWSLGMLLLATIAFIVIAIFMRKVAGVALNGVEEYSGYMLAILSSWGLAYTLFEKAHIRIDMAYQKLPSLGRSLLDVLALASVALVSVLIAWYAWPVLEKSLNNNSLSNTPQATPLWIPQLLWFCGYLWFAFSTVVLLVRVLLAALQGQPERIDEFAGIGAGEAGQ